MSTNRNQDSTLEQLEKVLGTFESLADPTTFKVARCQLLESRIRVLIKDTNEQSSKYDVMENILLQALLRETLIHKIRVENDVTPHCHRFRQEFNHLKYLQNIKVVSQSTCDSFDE